ncbi:hypothetical protein [Kallotenue papyrolyticum]|uniref:hypothetical protein n=1 Tax=Kallotenue papyrolyticum TaxID=1325125 RepID=UPI0004785DC8|nr:hypothetical protein [Kallotenue papyrolyticum]
MTISYQVLLIAPFVIIGALYGFRRGWREEAITTVGLLLALIFFGSTDRASLLGQLINRIVAAFASFFGTLLGTDLQATPLIAEDNPTTFQMIGFILVAILVYIIGSALGERRNMAAAGRLMGAVLGGINVILVGAQLFSMINQRNPEFFDTQTTIEVTPATGVNVLQNYLPSVFALLFILLLIILFLRLPKMRQ